MYFEGNKTPLIWLGGGDVNRRKGVLVLCSSMMTHGMSPVQCFSGRSLATPSKVLGLHYLPKIWERTCCPLFKYQVIAL